MHSRYVHHHFGKSACAILLAASATALSATKSYSGPNNGNFATSGYWSPAGVPANGDDVALGNINPNGILGDLTVSLTTTEPPAGFLVEYDSFTLNSSALTGYMIVNQTSGTLTTYEETIGTTTSDNTYNQSGGSIANIGDDLDIAVSSNVNTYTLAGSGTSLTVANETNIGVSGSGSFFQSGGTFTSLAVNLGVNSGSGGTFYLSGTAEFEPTYLYVGVAGTGAFNQSGGDVNANEIDIGSTGSSSSATYNFSGGTIESNIVINAKGTFNLQSGGNLTGNTVQINSGGIFKAAGGSGGYIQMSGGTLELLGYNLSIGLEGTAGTIMNGGSTASSLTVTTSLIGGIPYEYAGLIEDGSTGALDLNVNGGTSCGISLGGTNTYSGPTNVSALLQAKAPGAFSPNSAVTVLAGGTLDANTFAVSIGSLDGLAGTVNVGTGGNLSIGGLNASTFFSGQITGAGTVTKVGSGALTLNGGGTFTGNMVISAGTLQTNVANGLPTGASISFANVGGTLAINANQTLASYTASDTNATSFSNNANLTVGAGTSGCDFSGAGTFTMGGTGTYYLGFGSADSAANSDSSLSIAVSSGVLDLNKKAGTTAVAGPLQITGGSAVLSASNEIADTTTVTLSGGTFNLAGFRETIGGLAGTAGTVNLNGGQLVISNATDTTFGGSLSGNGALVKSGAGNLTLSNNSAYSGTYGVNAGQLTLQGNVGGSAFNAYGTGILEFSSATLNIPGMVLLASAGGNIEYMSSTVSNAFLRGPGAHTILSSGTTTFNGVTTYSSTAVIQNGVAVFNNFTNGGTINNNAALTFNGAENTTSGIINIENTVSTQDFTSEGVINIDAGGTMVNSVSNLYLGGGSRTYIGTPHPGGSITLQSGTTLEVNGALLVNDGTINGTTDVNYGGTAEGTGTYGPVNVTFGGVFQPGISSTSIIAGNSTSISALSGDGTVDNVAAAGNITLNVNSTIANSFSGTIQNSTGLLGLNLAGGGSLTLLTHPIASGNSINTYTGGTTITSGSLIIGAVGAFPAGTPVLNNGSFFIYANSTTGQITGNGNLTIGSVATGNAIATLAHKSGLSILGSLIITPGSKLDLTNNDLVIHTGTLAQIALRLAQGYSHGTWAGLTGIASSVAALSANRATTLGVATGLTTFDGQSVLPGDVLIKYTWLGDANLDGIVNSADLSSISLSGATWQTGDFNYDGVVNADDYGLFALGAAYGSSTNIAATLPEPGLMGMAFAIVATGWRRKKR